VNENRYYLYSGNARQILAAIGKGQRSIEVSVDLNKTVRSLSVKDDHVVFDHNNKLTRGDLLSISKRADRVFVLENNALRVLEYRDRYYYKLVPTNGAPTVEINGIKMHRSKGIDPFEDARLKVSEVVRSGDRVLDTCGGLGYTAVWSVRLGARQVLSVEYDEFVQRLRSENPWSADLHDRRIKIVSADVSEYIRELESESFHAVIHDPPRFSLAGELYGEEFYRELHRILVSRGRLFHYTGNPYVVRRGNTFLVNVNRRLRTAGFKRVVARHHLLGAKAVK
jgi:predicted methyltransferase